MEKITEYLIKSTVTESEVRAWEEIIMLPTYEIGEEEKNPVFLEKRVYQGSSGSVYPYPVVEKISDKKRDKSYRALFIENEYIKVMILPELGGRVQMAYDKVKQRHFVYYNQVIKPALVGLLGPWISGGIEFNWPQHHRPSTYLPTDYHIEEHEDGSKSIWCSEVERMYRTKGMAGFRLYPGKSYLEINAKVYNRTPLPQTFLWWANPAVVVNDDYFSVFPPDVNAVFDHGKRDVSSFPIATGTYYKCDYSAGVDISRYANIPVPTSYMAVNSKFDFVGGYEEGVGAGLLHIANHHVSTGKKQWTWGHGDFGQAWDRNLTDEDGPYIELMTGMYCDNQPDFTWLQPYEEKSWSQYFMPYQEVGLVKNATKDGVVNLSKIESGEFKVVLYTTAAHSGVRILISRQDHILLDETINCSPANPFSTTFDSCNLELTDIELKALDSQGVVLVSYKPEKREEREIPEPAKAAQSPEEIDSIEQLFLTGHHLEQYHHATYMPMDYYQEALRREPGDIRCNNAVGLLLLRRGQFAEAQQHFERAVATQTERNPNPYDGEAYYNLGFVRKIQGDIDGAYNALFKATWSGAWQDAGYMALAQIDMMRGDYQRGLDNIQRSLVRNWNNHRGRQLKVSLLRKIKHYTQAETLIEESLSIDLFNMSCRFEAYLVKKEQGAMAEALELKAKLAELMRGAVHSYLEYAFDYSNAGMYAEATELMEIVTSQYAAQYPIAYYALGYFASMSGDRDKALEYYTLAEQMPSNYCFPNKLEEILILNDAMELNAQGAKAPYYLGNFYYNARRYSESAVLWERSVSLCDSFPTVLRNLALAYYNKLNDPSRAVAALERAFALDQSDARIFMELDQLYKKMRYSHQFRSDLCQKHMNLVEQRDDLSIEYITLQNQLGNYQAAYDLLNSRIFHPWEGGEGKVTSQYILCRLSLAREAFSAGDYSRAIALLKECDKYPDNLGEGKLSTTEENDTHYFMGCAYEALGDQEQALYYYNLAVKGSNQPAIAFFYNDQQPDKILYQGLAWLKLGNTEAANLCFRNLIENGEKHINDSVKIDYFAVSLPDLLIWEDDLNVRNKIHCKLVMGMGEFGLGNKEHARTYFKEVLDMDLNHQVAALLLSMCD